MAQSTQERDALMPGTEEGRSRIEALERRMDKYDTIIDNLQAIVTRLETKHEVNTSWIKGILAALTLGATAVGGVIGAVATHLIH